jgi:hypothetical protein
MRLTRLVFGILCAASAVAHAAPAAPASWCANNEYTVFNCRTGHKVVSVCASPHLSQDHGYVQYRFGTPGKAMELAYPDLSAKPDTVFRLSKSEFRHDSGSPNVGYSLHFMNEGVRYVVVSDEAADGKRGSVLVDTQTRPQIAYLQCDNGTVESRLESLWNSEALPAAR